MIPAANFLNGSLSGRLRSSCCKKPAHGGNDPCPEPERRAPALLQIFRSNTSDALLRESVAMQINVIHPL